MKILANSRPREAEAQKVGLTSDQYNMVQQCVKKMIDDYYYYKADDADLSVEGLTPYFNRSKITYQGDDMITVEVPILGPKGTYKQEVELDDEGDGWFCPLLEYNIHLFYGIMDDSDDWRGFKKILNWK